MLLLHYMVLPNRPFCDLSVWQYAKRAARGACQVLFFSQSGMFRPLNDGLLVRSLTSCSDTL